MLPVDGGFDEAGNLTRDPGAIEKSQRPLPVGYWKGSGLSVVLDMIAAMMSLGRATHELSTIALFEAGVSQMFLALNPEALGLHARGFQIADEIVASVHESERRRKRAAGCAIRASRRCGYGRRMKSLGCRWKRRCGRRFWRCNRRAGPMRNRTGRGKKRVRRRVCAILGAWTCDRCPKLNCIFIWIVP